jgi:genome maintenance exonuclease 1
MRFKHLPFDRIELTSIEKNGKRFYDVNGDLFPSVTTVLSSLSKDGINEWRARVGEEKAERIKNSAAARGTKLHLMCEDYVDNKEDFMKGRMPTTVDLFKQIQPYLDENLESVYAIEASLYSKKLRAAGKCDLICRMHGVNCIVDYKTSTSLKKEEWIESYFLQETAYAMMVEELYQIPIYYIITLIATEEGSLQFFVKQPIDYVNKVINTFNVYHSNN